jgi:hypothetical protein
MATLSYVRVHSAGSIIRSAFAIYIRHFGVLFPTVLILQAPVIVAQALGAGEPHPVWVLILALVVLVAVVLSIAPVTVLIADICLGAAPDLRRAFGRAFGRLTGRVLLTGLLVWAAVFGGFLLLVVPGMIFTTWYMLGLSVVVLERTSARASLRRSRMLGKGSYLRNLGVLYLVIIGTIVPMLIVSAGIGFVGAVIGLSPKLLALIAGIISAAAAAPVSIGTILVYYDMRCRKEGYDANRLAEDLSH